MTGAISLTGSSIARQRVRKAIVIAETPNRSLHREVDPSQVATDIHECYAKAGFASGLSLQRGVLHACLQLLEILFHPRICTDRRGLERRNGRLDALNQTNGPINVTGGYHGQNIQPCPVSVFTARKTIDHSVKSYELPISHSHWNYCVRQILGDVSPLIERRIIDDKEGTRDTGNCSDDRAYDASCAIGHREPEWKHGKSAHTHANCEHSNCLRCKKRSRHPTKTSIHA